MLFSIIFITDITNVNDSVVAGEIASACVGSPQICNLAIINDNPCSDAPSTLYSFQEIIRDIIYTPPDPCNSCEVPIQGFVDIDSSFTLLGESLAYNNLLQGKFGTKETKSLIPSSNCATVVNNINVAQVTKITIMGSRRRAAWRVLLCNLGLCYRNPCSDVLISNISTPVSIDATACCEEVCAVCAFCAIDILGPQAPPTL
jgi:hypothetical protein